MTHKGDAMDDYDFAGSGDSSEAVAADARMVFGWDQERRPQDRAHDYMRGRGVQMGSDDTAMERVALGLADRAARAAVRAAAEAEYAPVIAGRLRALADSIDGGAGDGEA